MSAQTDTLLVELDVREIRAAHSAMSLLRNVLEPECAGIPLPDGRRVSPPDSAMMKLELALMTVGEEVL